MKKFLLTLLLVMFCNVSFAEIIKQNNTFDNSHSVISFFASKSSELGADSPLEISLKKETFSNNSNYTVFIKTDNPQKSFVVTIEDSKLKFSNNKIIKVQTQSDNAMESEKIAFRLTQEILNELINTNTLAIQMPLFTRDKTQVKYVVYNIPKLVIDEWKQVIEMN